MQDKCWAVWGTWKGLQLTCQGVLASAAAVWRAVSGAHRFVLDNQGLLAGCSVMW